LIAISPFHLSTPFLSEEKAQSCDIAGLCTSRKDGEYTTRVIFPNPSRERALQLLALHACILYRHYRTLTLQAITALPNTIITALTAPLASVPKLRRIAIGASAAGVPTFISIGMGAQAVNPMTEASRAIMWFCSAAALAGLAVMLWEDIRPEKLWAKIFVIGCLEIAVLAGLYQSLAWVIDKANDVSVSLMQRDAHETRIAVMEFKYLNAQLHPAVSTSTAVGITTPPVLRPRIEPKPDISLQLVYVKGFAAVLANTSKTTLRDPKFAPLVWDLDIERKDPLPAPVWGATANDWIRPGENMGPQAIISLPNVYPLVKQGDRIFGVIYVSCPDCARTKWYWVYAVLGKSGWFSEIPKGRIPMLNALFKSVPDVQKNPDVFFADVPQSDRKPIVEMP
jgi:hypothetical protein